MTDQQTKTQGIHWWEWISIPALTTGLIYLMGWSYAFVFYDQFHLGLLSLDIPGQYFIIYGFWILQKHGWWLVVPYVGILISWWWLQHTIQIPHRWLAASIPILILLAFITVYQLARFSAVQQFHELQATDYSPYPRIVVSLKANAPQAETAAIKELLISGCYRLLLENRGQLFLFYSHADAPQARMPTLKVPVGQVEWMQVLPQRNSCEA